MIRDINKNVFLLSIKASPATIADKSVGVDLMDTLKAHRKECVGMAANMIGINKAVIIAHVGLGDIVMFNPRILSKKGMYRTEEGCLSLTGRRETVRYNEMEVEYEDMSFEKKKGKFKGFDAEIIQHELDHLEGIII